ncbi:serine hydrolase domain-containing protein [Aeromicrobium sp.]|uniref:serine hydrolase domain-containing protein n=1 Tax=Aeromicrobium sp. TaxID=1871063 RepID=UPI002FC5C679
MSVQGSCDPRFQSVREEFERNFADRGEVGAAVCVMLDGEPVVDLWGGVADPATDAAWVEDTPVMVFSSTKGMTSTAAHVLIDRGQIDINAPVARYWPEFAKAGKENVTVRHLLTHQSGLATWQEQLGDLDFYNWERVTQLLADQEPFWEPGTRTGYHALTYGYLVGEVVRRVSGLSLGTFFDQEIAQPLGLDAWIGTPAEVHPRVAKSTYYVPVPSDLDGPIGDLVKLVTDYPESLPARLQLNNSNWIGVQENLDTPESYAAEIPAANGIASARGLATMYAPLSRDGSHNGVRLVRPESLAALRHVQSRSSVDASVPIITTSFSLGYMKGWDNRIVGPGASIIWGEDAFGHAGLGGSVGFADPSLKLAFAYVMNQHGPGTGINERGQSLVDATYRVLGSSTDEPGFWVRPTH